MQRDGLKEAIEELEITRLLRDRFGREGCLDPADRETVAYRIAEIMVTAKRLHTVALHGLTRLDSESPIQAELDGLAVTLVHLRDVIHDFDSAFFESVDGDPAPAYDYDGEESEEEEEESEFDQGSHPGSDRPRDPGKS